MNLDSKSIAYILGEQWNLSLDWLDSMNKFMRVLVIVGPSIYQSN